MFPITIITGFLGAGKTTLLNRLLTESRNLKIAVIVNDFGAVNIDARLIVGVTGEAIRLQNGCICCTIREDLLNTVKSLITSGEPIDHIVIETSGVSDPFAVAQTFQHADLRDSVVVDGIVTVVDAEQIAALGGEQFVLAMDQIHAADLVLLNKIDLLDRDERLAAREFVLGLEPAARIIETSRCDVPLQLLLSTLASVEPRAMPQSTRDVHVHAAGAESGHDHNHAFVFDTHSLSINSALDRLAIRRAVERLPLSIYRAKGLLHLADSQQRATVLHVVGKRASLAPGEPWGAQEPQSTLVFIGEHGGVDAAALDALFAGCVAGETAQTGDIIDQSFDWVRSVLQPRSGP